MIPPAHFTPVVEETGLIDGALGARVLRQAYREARRWQGSLLAMCALD